jgi:hypothetical protein
MTHIITNKPVKTGRVAFPPRFKNTGLSGGSLSLGMLSGSLLLASGSNASSNLYPGFTLLWSQGLLASGVILSVWLVLEFIFKP